MGRRVREQKLDLLVTAFGDNSLLLVPFLHSMLVYFWNKTANSGPHQPTLHGGGSAVALQHTMSRIVAGLCENASIAN